MCSLLGRIGGAVVVVLLTSQMWGGGGVGHRDRHDGRNRGPPSVCFPSSDGSNFRCEPPFRPGEQTNGGCCCRSPPPPPPPPLLPPPPSPAAARPGLFPSAPRQRTRDWAQDVQRATVWITEKESESEREERERERVRNMRTTSFSSSASSSWSSVLNTPLALPPLMAGAVAARAAVFSLEK